MLWAVTPLAILGSDASRELDERLGGLASFFGVDSQRVEVCASSSPEGLASQLGPEVQGVGLSAATACLLQARLQSPEALLAVLAGHGRQIFAYGFEPSPQHDQAAQWLSRGAVRRIVPAGQPGPWEWPAAGRPFTRQLAGSQFDRAARASDCGFELDEAGGSVTVLARAAGRPVFARAGDVGGGLFLWASPGMASLDQPVPEAEGMGGLYESVLPVVVYLRSAFPGATWENPAPTARVIIDDPLLGARYGFLDYTQLARSLETLDYALTIAFIPWNHRRTSRAGAGLVRAAAGRLSVCLHGCDHTRNEFGALDGPLLEQKTWLAVQRMNWHQEQTGLPFDNVMVFPQGRFSRAAVSALRRCGCLAAVNTTRAPVDGAQDRLTLADELMPAASRYSGFPIFHRRYPKQASHFAIDLFLGKPAHIVEHHEVFEHGCQTLETTVRALKALEPRPGLAGPGRRAGANPCAQTGLRLRGRGALLHQRVPVRNPGQWASSLHV